MARSTPTHSVTFPNEFANNPAVAGRSYYALPTPLLDAFAHQIGTAAFNGTTTLNADENLSGACGDLSSVVGFRNTISINYDLLHRPTRRLSPAADLVSWSREVARSYCGWLVTSPTFVREHEHFLDSWHLQALQGGMYPAADPTVMDPPYLQALSDFCQRWRLRGLAGAYLPDPHRIQALDANVLSHEGSDAGVGLFLPDTTALPPRDELWTVVTRIMEQQRGRPPAHLKEWYRIAGAKNPGVRKRQHLARLFVLQHYWRVLHQRYAPQIAAATAQDRRSAAAIKCAFTEFFLPSRRRSFGPPTRLLEKDLRELAKVFGTTDWASKSPKPWLV